VVAYVMPRGNDLTTIEAGKLTHINFAFAAIINGEIAFRFRSPEHETRTRQAVETLIGLKKVNPDLKLVLSVGGWGNCGGFSDAALTAESRGKLASSAVKIIQSYGFDGIDLDWEYPGQVGGGEVFRPEDRENFTLMLKSLREELDKTGRHWLLTIATGADDEYFRWTQLGEAQKYLDFINVMSYDYYSGLSRISGHHSNLKNTDLPGSIPISTEVAVDRHIRAGVPASKIVVGVPFYGRFWRGVPDTGNGLYQQGATTGMYKVYTELVDTYINKNTFTRYWDKPANAPYLYSRDSAMVITYDDPESLTLKAKYIREKKLGGFMFWEYFGDRTGILLETIHQNLK
jgi:chitinase